MPTQILRAMEKRRCKSRVMSFNTIIESLCKDKMTDQSLAPFRRDNWKGDTPIIFTYNCLINGVCSFGNWGEVRKLMTE